MFVSLANQLAWRILRLYGNRTRNVKLLKFYFKQSNFPNLNPSVLSGITVDLCHAGGSNCITYFTYKASKERHECYKPVRHNSYAGVSFLSTKHRNRQTSIKGLSIFFCVVLPLKICYACQKKVINQNLHKETEKRCQTIYSYIFLIQRMDGFTIK